MRGRASIRLRSGAAFEGFSFGAARNIVGEFVFTTGMVGYPESLTDPSYRGQILVLTYPLIGNYGVPDIRRNDFGIIDNFESERIQAAGLVVADYSERFNHWAAERSLAAWLKSEGVPAVMGVDTRAVTKLLREKGTMMGKLFSGEGNNKSENLKGERWLLKNLVAEVSCKEPISYSPSGSRKKIILIDCGVKHGILRSLARRRCEIVRVPWDFPLSQSGLKYDGVVISNGPGDPKTCGKTIRELRLAIKKGVPMLGICLGHQLLALAAGANTYKMRYGHRSQNQPCLDMTDRRCFVTTQNHGYAVRRPSIPKDWRTWFLNLNDGTVEGLRHKHKKILTVQFHPEASPGPDDTEFIFDEFVNSL